MHEYAVLHLDIDAAVGTNNSPTAGYNASANTVEGRNKD